MRPFLILLFLLTQVHPTPSQEPDLKSQIHTVLPQDAIPAIFSPDFIPASQADIDKNAPMIAVSINGEHHAYSMYLLNRHEIVNDVVGGEPIASTW